MSPFEQLFQDLHDPAKINALIGTTEDLHLDCKSWPSKDEDAQRVIAKSICGFANADGGVIVIGLDARSSGKYDPDVIQGAVPVADIITVKSRIESLVGDLVEPPLRGVRCAAVSESPGATSGFVIVEVPPTDGLPCRSRKDWMFYQRIASGTYRMEYFQIADMFGRRHRPDLRLFLEVGNVVVKIGRPVRELTLGIENRGRAVAKFVSIRFERATLGLDTMGINGTGGLGLPLRAVEPGWFAFGGGADHVIYPGTVLKITKLERYMTRLLRNPTTNLPKEAYLPEFELKVLLAADEVPEVEDSKTIPALQWSAN